MKVDVKELQELLPESQAYEVETGKTYLLCVDRKLTIDALRILRQELAHTQELTGIRFVLLEFVPKIFLLEQEGQ